MAGPDDWLPLSGIQHFCFCRRQWALIHLEQQWAENRRTVEGQLDHARCHDADQTERRGGLLITRGMQVVSRRLGLSGNCDVVEFRADPEGIPLQSTEGLWKPMPVEYKHGRAKARDVDRLQLCAQAMALEEMLVCSIPEGALFYEETRRREVVPLTEEPLIEQCDDLDQLRGLEGEAAQRYFDCFDSLILQQHDDFSFAGRSRRPPLDNTNALLSFAYSLLASDCTAALQSVGLDPYVGFLPRARPGRRSLALDLMEELRTVYADRFVLSCINQKIMTPKHFQKQENGAVLLTDEGRRAFLGGWQTRKQETITHPFLNEKLPWGLVPYVQALLLARTLRGDMELYPPFFWK